ncbi:MAG: SUMF1/EgtB/PvdO family nonheme iron enzyme [Labilithrix sp.]|nr:SUMF1/EgtB/PvdO family nonheme iron enzyme [Labilithrix sp.]MCW5811871.1 SUMF1/EgtB/PvdO family nonheme iron enzyme [Labilithrix sp.]
MRVLLAALAAFVLVACAPPSDGDGAEIPLVDTNGSSPDGEPGDTASSASTDKEASTETGTNAKPNPNASAPSCARLHGGSTCGPDGKDDCCATAKQGAHEIGKYMVTAGRMRAFIDAHDGDIAGFVKDLPAGKWNAKWDAEGALPTDRASADAALGPAGKKACEQGAFTGHTFWTPKNGDDFSDFSQDVLDEKALNCVPWHLLQALCIWDGGHLATAAELKAAFTNGGKTRYPWGNDELARLDAPDAAQRLNIEGGFETSPLPATFRKRSDGKPAEASFMIAPPGRFPKGNNAVGIADSAGNLLEWAGDQPRRFVWKGDFEHHAANAGTMNFGYLWMDTTLGGAWIWGTNQLFGNAGNAQQRGGYYAVGGRCAF